MECSEGNVFRDLKKLVNAYLAESSLPAVGPSRGYIKSATLIGSWVLCYTLLNTFGTNNIIVSLSTLALLFMLTCGLQFCIMHDASHQSFSENRFANKLALNFALSVLGGCSLSWHQEHVVRHHGHTNILGSDPDVYASHVLRLHPSDQWHWWHKWQHYFAIPLYSFMWLHWVYNDLVNAIFNTYQLKGLRYWQFWFQIVVGLIPHIILGLVIPYYAFHSFKLVAFAYTGFFMLISITMAMTFVLAHVSEGQIFFNSKEEINKDWAIHQLETTCDFSVDNPFLIWILGGLNFQVEHHIFPSLNHLHYPAVQRIVKKYCQENGVPYHEEKTVRAAVGRHLAHLKAMGQPPVAAEESAMIKMPS